MVAALTKKMADIKLQFEAETEKMSANSKNLAFELSQTEAANFKLESRNQNLEQILGLCKQQLAIKETEILA